MKPRMRVGLVLGAGGPVGHAYHAGALAAVAAATGWDPRDAEIMIGTSAGSIVSALLRAGLSAPDLMASVTSGTITTAGLEILAHTGPVNIPAPGFAHVDVLRGAASMRALLQGARRPWAVRAGPLAAALLPPGKVSTAGIVASVRGLFGDGWPEAATWICAVRLDDGQRVIFARQGAGRASLADAVAASCALPAFFQPVTIAGERYVDGGVWSPTNADLLAEHRLDMVVVSSPMSGGSLSPVRALSSHRLRREVALIRKQRMPVLVIEPDGVGQVVMGGNLMRTGRLHLVAQRAYEAALARIPALEGGAFLRDASA